MQHDTFSLTTDYVSLISCCFYLVYSVCF